MSDTRRPDDGPAATRSIIEVSEINAWLARMRSEGPAGWSRLDCAFEGEGDAWRDDHATARLAVLMALQYDRRPDDRPLVLHLLQQETRYCQTSPYQGISTALRIAAVIATHYRAPSMAWLMLEAKRANFDTHCGFDSEFLLCGDVAATWAWVQASDHPRRQDFLEHVGDDDAPAYDQGALDDWWAWQREQYPDRWEDETPLAQLELCAELGDTEAAVSILERWQAAPDEALTEAQALSTARSWWETLGYYDRAAQLQQRLDARLPSKPWDRASDLCRSAKVHARAGEASPGCERLDALRDALSLEEGWQRYGLGLNAALAGAAVAEAAIAEPALLRRAFDWTDALIADGARTSLVLLQALVKLAEALGDTERHAHYQAAAAAERARIDAQR